MWVVWTAPAHGGSGDGSGDVRHEGWVPLEAVTPHMELDHGRRIDADGVRWVRVLAPAKRFGGFPHAPPRPPPVGLRDPEAGLDDLRKAVARAPRAGWVSLGVSRQGRGIEAAWFGQGPGRGVPSVRILAGHHGNEGSSWEVALELADQLAAGDGVEPELTRALDDRTVWVVPYVNPDGAVAHTRHNAADVDLNRNYDYHWRDDQAFAGEVPFSEPESRAVASWGYLTRPALGWSLHSGAHNLGWVWNHTEAPAADADALEAQALVYSEGIDDPSFWVTNGAAWYVTFGDTNDWSYGRYGTWDYTLELSETKSPPPEELEHVLQQHVPALMAALSQPLHTVAVVDSVTGEPVEAWVQAGSGRVRWTDPVHGVAGLPGSDSLRAGAPGYRDATAEPGVEVVVLEPVDVAHVAATVILEGELLPPLPGPGPWRLLRAGEDAVSVDAGAPAPAPGFWTVMDAHQRAYPHALLVAERVAEASDLEVMGARAFVGGESALVEVSPSIGAADAIWARGAWLASGDTPGEGYGMGDDGYVVAGAACASVPESGHLWLAGLSIVAWARRRNDPSAKHHADGTGRAG